MFLVRFSRAFEDHETDVDRVSIEYAREGSCDDTGDAGSLYGNGRKLAGASAAEVISRNDDIPRPFLFEKVRI